MQGSVSYGGWDIGPCFEELVLRFLRIEQLRDPNILDIDSNDEPLSLDELTELTEYGESVVVITFRSRQGWVDQYVFHGSTRDFFTALTFL